MSAISPSASQQVLQSAWKQVQAQQAKQFAAQAAQTANDLQTQSARAQASADKAQLRADQLHMEAGRAGDVSTRANAEVRNADVLSAVPAAVTQAINTSVQYQQATTTQTQASATQATTNTQGQTIGTVVNVTA